MSGNQVMTNEEVRALVFGMAASIFAGKPQPAPSHVPSSTGKYARREDFEDALEAVVQLLATLLDDMPEKVSEDFKQQEAIRHFLDNMLAGHILKIRTIMDRPRDQDRY